MIVNGKETGVNEITRQNRGVCVGGGGGGE